MDEMKSDHEDVSSTTKTSKCFDKGGVKVDFDCSCWKEQSEAHS